MDTYIGERPTIVLMCISGPDMGKRFVIGETGVMLGRSTSCHILADDDDVADEHVMFVLRNGRPNFRSKGDQDVYLDGQAVTQGKLRLGQQLRVGRSLWQIADSDTADQFSGWVAKVGGHITAVAGVSKIEGFNFRKMFSDVVKRRSDQEIEEYFNVGSPTTTPAVLEIDTNWPRPWLFARAAMISILVYLGFVFALGKWDNDHLVPGMMFMGSFAIPCSVLLFFIEVNVPRNVSLYQIIKLLLVGGVISLIAALFLFDFTSDMSGDMGKYRPMIAGPVEELAKLGALILIVQKVRYRWILNGLLFGAVVGCGFAAFESAGYAFRVGLESMAIVNIIAQQEGYSLAEAYPFAREQMLSEMKNVITLRGALTICGSHLVYSAIVGAALWRVRGQRQFQFAMLKDATFIRALLTAIALHAAWNSPWFTTDGYVYVKFAVIGFVGWVIVIGFVNEGLKQIRAAQAELEESAREIVTTIVGARSPGEPPRGMPEEFMNPSQSATSTSAPPPADDNGDDW